MLGRPFAWALASTALPVYMSPLHAAKLAGRADATEMSPRSLKASTVNAAASCMQSWETLESPTKTLEHSQPVALKTTQRPTEHGFCVRRAAFVASFEAALVPLEAWPN